MKYLVFNNNPYDPYNQNLTSIPQYSENQNSDKKLINWGYNNLYPEYLKELLNKSAKHSAIVKGKASMVGGNGFSKNNLSIDALNFLGNPYGVEDLDAILAKIAYDNEIYGGWGIQIIWSKDRSKIARINYIDPSKLRIHTPDLTDDNWNQVEKYWYCDFWKNTRKYKPVLFNGFDVKNRQEASQILYVKDYRPGTEWYSQPEYLSATNWIEAEWEIGKFHLKNIQKGFHPSMMINFTTGIPSGEEQDFLINQLKKEYEGAQNAGNVIFTFSEDKDTAPIITPIQLNHSDEKFIQLNKEVTEGIFVGHRVTNPILFGIKTEGQLGGATEMVDAMRVFQAMYVDSKQNSIEKIFNRLLRINNISDKLIINKHKIDMEVKVVPTDILNILQSSISDQQKKIVFESLGYSEEMANKLINKIN